MSKRRISITITESLYDNLRSNATKYHRSISQEIEYRLEKDSTLPTTENKITTAIPTPTLTTNKSKRKAIIGINSNSKNDYIDEYEQHMSDPNNEYYQKIKKYFTHTDPDLDAFNKLLTLADDNNFPEIAREYDYAIKTALDITLTHELSRSDWKQIVGYLR